MRAEGSLYLTAELHRSFEANCAAQDDNHGLNGFDLRASRNPGRMRPGAIIAGTPAAFP